MADQEIDWLYLTAIAVVLFALSTVIDKRLVAGLFPSAWIFNIVFGALSFVRGVCFVIPAGLIVGFDGGSGIAWAFAGGILFGASISLFLHALSMEDVSRAANIQAVTPVFIMITAVTLFGETVTWVQALGVLIVVAGVMLINVRPVAGKIRPTNTRAFALLVLSAILMAWAMIVTDQATARMNVYAVEGVRALGMSCIVLTVHWRPKYTSLVMATLRKPKVAGLTFLSEGFMVPIAALALITALSVGPVSLVGAGFAAWPLAVLVLSAALSTRFWNVLNEPLDRQTLGLKTVATLLVVGGVVVLRL